MYWHCLIGSVQRDSRHFNGLYIKQSEDELRSQTWNVVSCVCWMSFRSCDAQITHSLAHQKRASKDRGLSLSCGMNEQSVQVSSSTLCTEESDTSQTNKRSPSVPLCALVSSLSPYSRSILLRACLKHGPAAGFNGRQWWGWSSAL